jgi:mRNA-degrading endonuclease YafQ of YafQ-DinJ toxin-antitoxin module
MFKLVFTNRFKKDVKLLQRRGYEMELLKEAILYIELNGHVNSKIYLINYLEAIQDIGRLILNPIG